MRPVSTRYTLTAAATLLLFCNTVTKGFEPHWLPDGEDVKKAVAARRGKTELSKLALSMAPGTWAELKTEGMSGGFWSSPRVPDADKGRKVGGLHIGTWSDDAHWDSRTGQFLFFGVRQTRKFVAYSEEDNKWSVIDFVGKENAPKIKQKFGHQYSCNAFDPVNSIFFTLNSRYDVLKDQWQPLVKGGRSGKGPMTMAYSIDLKGLLSPTKDRKMQFFSDAQRKWTVLGPAHAHGYHGIAQENPYRHEVLFMAGNDSRAVAIVDKDGNIRPMKDYPRECTIRHHDITVDPQSGRYLILDPPHNEFYEFDSDLNEYRLLDDSPPTEGGLVAHIPEYGVNMWAGGSKTLLYKHNPEGKAPSQKAQPLAKKLSWNSAVIGGEVTGGTPVPEAFLCINPGKDAGTESIDGWARVIPVGLKSGGFERVIDKLDSRQKYVVRSFVKNYVGKSWSESASLTTDPAPPSVEKLTVNGDQQLDGDAPAITFLETPEHPLYAVGKSPDWTYRFSDYGARPTPLHLDKHKLFSAHARGKLVLDLNGGAIVGKDKVAILTFRGENSRSASITIQNGGAIDMGGIDTHAAQHKSNEDYGAGGIRIGTPEQRAGTIRIGYLHAYGTGERAGSADIRLYGSGDVTIGTKDKPGEIRTDTKAWDGSDIVIDHSGNLVVGAMRLRTEGWRGGRHAGRVTLNGNNSSGDAEIGSIVAWNSRRGKGKHRRGPMSIANYRNVILGDIDCSYTGEGRRFVPNLEINDGISGNIVITGKLNLGSAYDEDRQKARYPGAANLACGGTVGMVQLDLDNVRFIVMDSGSGASIIQGSIANFETAGATGSGSTNDPKVSGEARLRAPEGQTVRYRYEAGGVNSTLGGHVWQLRNVKGDEPGGLLKPQ